MSSATMHQIITYSAVRSIYGYWAVIILEDGVQVWCIQRERSVHYESSCSLYLCEIVHINVGIVTKL
jgi:hypothetical protein